MGIHSLLSHYVLPAQQCRQQDDYYFLHILCFYGCKNTTKSENRQDTLYKIGNTGTPFRNLGSQTFAYLAEKHYLCRRM